MTLIIRDEEIHNKIRGEIEKDKPYREKGKSAYTIFHEIESLVNSSGNFSWKKSIYSLFNKFSRKVDYR